MGNALVTELVPSGRARKATSVPVPDPSWPWILVVAEWSSQRPGGKRLKRRTKGGVWAERNTARMVTLGIRAKASRQTKGNRVLHCKLSSGLWRGIDSKLQGAVILPDRTGHTKSTYLHGAIYATLTACTWTLCATVCVLASVFCVSKQGEPNPRDQ